jgi:hypothetical protein
MTTDLEFGNDELDYNQYPNDSGLILAQQGWQAQFVIDSSKVLGFQADLVLAGNQRPVGMQTEVYNQCDEVHWLGI